MITKALRWLCLCAVLVGLSACSKFKTYNGPEVTAIQVHKSSRSIHLLHHDQVLRSYPFELGFTPRGHKMFEGDGRTPEGLYFIDRRNPQSDYHLSLGISYPNARDAAIARELGLSPGGDIFIHGTPKRWQGQNDWTAGCIAVSNRAIEEIYAMVQNGTPILINP